jgi:hypothetical protein
MVGDGDYGGIGGMKIGSGKNLPQCHSIPCPILELGISDFY